MHPRPKTMSSSYITDSFSPHFVFQLNVHNYNLLRMCQKTQRTWCISISKEYKYAEHYYMFTTRSTKTLLKLKVDGSDNQVLITKVIDQPC